MTTYIFPDTTWLYSNRIFEWSQVVSGNQYAEKGRIKTIPYNSQAWLAVFMMLGSVLMLNLLIAVFSKTYEDMTAEVSNRKCLFIPA